nr:hypothetical protein [Tanacetum cinerariifolium]
MDLESAQNNVVAKLPLLKQENDNSFKPVLRATANVDGTSTSIIPEVLGTKKACQGIKTAQERLNVEDTSSKAMVAIDGAGFDWSYMADDEVPTNMARMDFSDSEEFQHPEFKGYGLKNSKSACVDTSNEIKKAPDALIIED